MGSRGHIIPAQYVPEELVNQAQVVLQGKSRNVIIRELQRTNLDVNLAVNNLLSRDDEDFDDGDDSSDQLIQSDDLMSLLDSGLHNEHSVIIDSDFADEVFSYPLRIRGANLFGASGSSNGSGGGRSHRSLRDEAFSFVERDLLLSGSSSAGGGGGANSGSGGSKNRFYNSLQSQSQSELAKDIIRKKYQQQSVAAAAATATNEPLSPISFSDQQEYWPGSVDRKFVAIASMYGELIAVTQQGQLCQWRWQDPEPFKAQLSDGTVYYHPKVGFGLVAAPPSPDHS